MRHRIDVSPAMPTKYRRMDSWARDEMHAATLTSASVAVGGCMSSCRSTNLSAYNVMLDWCPDFPPIRL
jgi:hypothetical protein